VDGALPAEVTSFVGRRHELAAVRRLFTASRVVTLTGAGGVGKTRLALRAASEMQRGFSGGVHLVRLGSLEDPRLLPKTVGAAFGLRDEAVQPIDRLADFLAEQNVLLLLDNCEHVADACAVLVGKLLAAAPGLRVLATSRQRLGVEGEHLLPVEPFSLPPGDGEHDPAGGIAGYDAVSLFSDRAAAVAPRFELTPENRALVAEICRRLDGVPLAIELAAVWLRVLSLPELSDRLDTLAWLGDGPRTAPARQRGLEALIDWSYQLCSPAERALWVRLSVFRDGFDLAAAEAVCAGDGVEPAEVVRLLADLVDKSVLIRDGDTFGRAARYRMLGMLAQFGAERLTESGSAEALAARHGDYYRSLAREYAAREFSAVQLRWILRLRREHANLRAALESCLAAGNTVAALEMGADLATYCLAGGHLAEGREWLDRALSLDSSDGSERARALGAWLKLGCWLGVHTHFGRRLRQYHEIVAALDDPAVTARCHTFEGMAKYFLGELAAGCAILETAVVECDQVGEHALRVEGLALLAVLKFLLGRRGAHGAGEQAVALCTANGKPAWHTEYATWALAVATWDRGDFESAIELHREAVRLGYQMHDHSGIALSLETLAWCAASARRFTEAARLLGAAQMAWRLCGAGRTLPSTQAVSRARCADPAREALGQAAFEREFAAGEALDLDGVVALALGEREPETGAAPTGAEPAPRLTRRESEVAALVAEGLSNKQIAARLVISQRTAEAHVEHILTKLGFTSRSQVAAWFATTQRA